jgi:putative Holliday junction resolvase
MGIDFGERRTGVALSDPTGTLASPLETIERRSGQRLPLKALEEIARAHEVTHLVVGIPLDLRGEETEWARRIRTAGDELARRLGVPVAYVDERFTSVQARRAVRSAGLPRIERERKDRVDRAAAALMLQGWLDRRTPEVP